MSDILTQVACPSCIVEETSWSYSFSFFVKFSMYIFIPFLSTTTLWYIFQAIVTCYILLFPLSSALQLKKSSHLKHYKHIHNCGYIAEWTNFKPRLVSRCRSSAEWINPFCSLSNTRKPSTKSSKTGFSRFLLIVDKIGKNISKLIRRSEYIHTIHFIDINWLRKN